MEAHKKHLQNLCRVCGHKPKGYAYEKGSSQCSAVLSSVFGITVGEDNDDTHPPVVCNQCYLTMRQLHTAKETGRYRGTDLTPNLWSPHSPNCQLCDAPPMPRRRPKKKAKGRPSGDNIHHWSQKVTHHLSNLHTHKYAESSLEVSNFLSNPYLEYCVCQICKSVPSEPVQILGCQHLLCKGCVYRVCTEETDTPFGREFSASIRPGQQVSRQFSYPLYQGMWEDHGVAAPFKTSTLTMY